MVKWRWYSYDTWGNKKDGYEVNQVFRTSIYVDIPEVVLNSDEAIKRHLKKDGFIKKGVRGRDITFEEFMYEDSIGIMFKGKPIGELRREK